MTRMGEDPGKRRGKAKQGWRGKTASNDTATYFLKDFSWGERDKQPKNLIAPFPIPGKWIYPAPGKIQWKMSK